MGHIIGIAALVFVIWAVFFREEEY